MKDLGSDRNMYNSEKVRGREEGRLTPGQTISTVYIWMNDAKYQFKPRGRRHTKNYHRRRGKQLKAIAKMCDVLEMIILKVILRWMPRVTPLRPTLLVHTVEKSHKSQ